MQHVAGVIAGRAVDAQTDIDSGVRHFLHPRNACTEQNMTGIQLAARI